MIQPQRPNRTIGKTALVLALIIGALACYHFSNWWPAHKAEMARAEAVQDSIAARAEAMAH